MTNEKEISLDFWHALDDSPFLMLSLVSENGHAIPMTAQLDKDADSAIWFFTAKNNRLAAGGPAMAQFASKGHKVFACIRGTLSAETNRMILDKLWSKPVESWYEGGKEDPNLLLLRFDLADAEVWEADASVKGLFKMMTGMTLKPGEMGEHETIRL